jgi:hypothetical protein
MIPYIEVLQWNNYKTGLNFFALVEPSEFWFELSYYEIGEFEIYAAATSANLSALKKGNFVKIPHKDFVWVITSIQYEFNASGARMISAKGLEAKSIIGKRIIRDPLNLTGNLSEGLQRLFMVNLGSGAIYVRQIPGLGWLWNGLSGKTTEAQATRDNLWNYTSKLLKLHKVGAISTLHNSKILYSTVNGQDKSDYVIFSQSLDNLISATYFTSDEDLKTDCQIVSTFNEQEGSGTARTSVSHDYIAYYPANEAGASGIDRAEITIQSNLSTKVKDEDGTEREIDPSGAEYIAMQQAEGAAALAEKHTITEFNGEIDLANSHYVFGEDFFIGDFVKIYDEFFGYEAKSRVTKYTFKQDASGYGEIAEYGNE